MGKLVTSAPLTQKFLYRTPLLWLKNKSRPPSTQQTPTLPLFLVKVRRFPYYYLPVRSFHQAPQRIKLTYIETSFEVSSIRLLAEWIKLQSSFQCNWIQWRKKIYNYYIEIHCTRVTKLENESFDFVLKLLWWVEETRYYIGRERSCERGARAAWQTNELKCRKIYQYLLGLASASRSTKHELIIVIDYDHNDYAFLYLCHIIYSGRDTHCY